MLDMSKNNLVSSKEFDISVAIISGGKIIVFSLLRDNRGDRGTIYYSDYAPSCLIEQVAFLGHGTALSRQNPTRLYS